MHNMPGTRGIYFDEGPGYVLICMLGQGVYGTAYLVRNVQTGDIGVRKEQHWSSEATRARMLRTPPEEFTIARKMQHISSTAKALGWVRYARYDAEHEKRIFEVTYWDYHNAGTWDDFHIKLVSGGISLPEQWLWYWLSVMLQVTSQMHYIGIAHTDGHAGNWFLHWNSGDPQPQIGLGDFGLAQQYPPNKSSAGRDAAFIFDYRHVKTQLELLMELAGPHKALEDIAESLNDNLSDALGWLLSGAQLEERMRELQCLAATQAQRAPCVPVNHPVFKLLPASEEQRPPYPYEPVLAESDAMLCDIKVWKIIDLVTQKKHPDPRQHVLKYEKVAEGGWSA